MCRSCRSVLLAAFMFVSLFINVPAWATLVTFEGLPDNLSLSNEISGLFFNGATALTAGVSLNEFDFPPKSGDNVAAALTGLLEITFVDLMDTVSGYFSYADSLTLSIYDANGGLLASAQSAGAGNLGGNELITLGGQGIAMLQVTSSSGFTLDDFSYDINSIPEPEIIFLFIIGAIGMWVLKFFRIRSDPR